MIDFRAWAARLPPGEGRVRREGSADLVEIVLDHPRTRNALHPRMMVELADAIGAARDARVVILRGEGGTFCSGGNLDSVRRHLVAPNMAEALVAFMQAACDALESSDAIVLGVLEGAALGGGAELLAACDLVTAAPDARIGWVQARLGVSPGFGGGLRLLDRVGPRLALRLMTEARAVAAPDALAMGLVDVVATDPVEAARARAADLLALDAGALRAPKRILRAARALPRAEARAEERALFAALWGAPAHLRALGG